MTEDEVDAIIAPLYARGQIARDEAWRAFEATLAELRANMISQARFIGNFGHLATVAEQNLRQSMPEAPVGYSQSLPDPGYSGNGQGDFASPEEQAWWERTQARRPT